MIVCNLWATVNSVTSNPGFVRSEFWITLSVWWSMAQVAINEFRERGTRVNVLLSLNAGDDEHSCAPV